MRLKPVFVVALAVLAGSGAAAASVPTHTTESDTTAPDAAATELAVTDTTVPESTVPASTAPGSTVPVPPRPDVVSIVDRAVLSSTTVDAARRAAKAAHVGMAQTTGISAGLRGYRRGSSTVGAPPAGYRYPMSISAVPTTVPTALMSADIATVIGRGQVVLNELTATRHKVRSGDVMELMAASGAVVSLRIGLVAADEAMLGAEVLAPLTTAERLGYTKRTRVILWGRGAARRMNDALRANGITEPRFGVFRSWVGSSPDETPGMAKWKVINGEFAYRLPTSKTVVLWPPWVGANIRPREQYTGVLLRASCNKRLHTALQAALTEVAKQGLAKEIDVVNSNRYGGCFLPRFNRRTGSIGFLSRHSWGSALDINTTQNPQGAVPKLNCDVVRIFRKHGFIWGGNFRPIPDGMHFEYVGEPRDQIQYPSRYCPNRKQASAGTAPTSRPLDVLAGDGFGQE